MNTSYLLIVEITHTRTHNDATTLRLPFNSCAWSMYSTNKLWRVQ